jgi:hypothetical protein
MHFRRIGRSDYEEQGNSAGRIPTMNDPNSQHPTADPTRISPEIYVYATNKNFLNIYDALRIEKFKIEVASYDPGSGKQTGLAAAWLDLDEMRLLIHLVTLRLFPTVLTAGGRMPRFERFGGSDRDGAVESRTFLLEWDPGTGGRFAGYPYRLTIANGPGVRTPTGAVQPRGEPTSRQQMRLPEADLMEILLAVGAHLRAKEPDLLTTKAQARAADIRKVQTTRSRAGATSAPAGRQGERGTRPVHPAAPDETADPPVSAPPPPATSLRRPAGRGTGPAGSPAAARPGASDLPPDVDLWAGMEVLDGPPPTAGSHH